jgi:hypothetical protein
MQRRGIARKWLQTFTVVILCGLRELCVSKILSHAKLAKNAKNQKASVNETSPATAT